jgi:hypothetical protein
MPQTRRPLSSGGDVQRRTRKSMGGIRPSRRAFRSCPGGPKKLDSGSARRRAGRVPRGGCGDNCLVCRTCVCQPGRDVADWSAGGAGAAATKLRHGVFEHRLGSRWGPRAADVLVIGGGLAGGWAATAAVRAGARVVLLDKRYFGTSGVTATGGARKRRGERSRPSARTNFLRAAGHLASKVSPNRPAPFHDEPSIVGATVKETGFRQVPPSTPQHTPSDDRLFCFQKCSSALA